MLIEPQSLAHLMDPAAINSPRVPIPMSGISESLGFPLPERLAGEPA